MTVRIRLRAAGLAAVAVLFVVAPFSLVTGSTTSGLSLSKGSQLLGGSTGSSSTSSPLPQSWIQRRWNKAAALAALEQSVEDYNADWIARSTSTGDALRHRRLICLPLDDGFDPPPGVFSHKHVQTGDKISLPSTFWQSIQVNRAEVPWLFRVQRIDGVTGPRVELQIADDDDTITECQSLVALDSVVAGPLDFRAPANYVFVPWWMMRALGLRPRDVVQVEMIETVPPGSLAKLRPHSQDFARDISNPHAVLETELRHYSSLTQGSTIAMDYNQKRYWFDVVELRSAPRGERAPAVKVQDCDIATDFLPSRDVLLEQKKKKRERLLQKQQEK